MFDDLRGRMNRFWNNDRTLEETDPEFVELFSRFAYDEVIHESGANHPDLDDATRAMAILATLIGCQGLDDYELMLPVAFESGVSGVQAKEIVYQAVAYLGFGRVLPFLKRTNEVLGAMNVSLPLPPQGTVTPQTRAEAGERAQIDIFGERMRGFAQSGPEETRHINKWLADNCFGDYYTRGGLDVRHREMITLCFLAAQGGCEPQLTAHAGANLKVGNDVRFLIAVVSQCMPYIGYPRTLNALRCIREATQAAEYAVRPAERSAQPARTAQGR